MQQRMSIGYVGSLALAFGLVLGMAAGLNAQNKGSESKSGTAGAGQNSAGQAGVTSGNLKVDPGHSFVLFAAKHFNAGYTWGRFNQPTGTITWDAADPAKSRLEIAASVKNLDTNDAKRDEHLKGPDFFNAKQYPDITFKSTSVKKVSDDTFEVTGDITLRDVTKPVTVQLKKTGEGDMRGTKLVGFQTEFTVNRNDFGVKGLPGGVGDEIRLIVALEAREQK